jgi:hypothetical protein
MIFRYILGRKEGNAVVHDLGERVVLDLCKELEGRKYSGVQLGEKVVLDLCKELEGREYHIYFDNYFASIALVQKCKLTGLASCGTVRSNRKCIPTLKDDRELGRGEHDWSHRSDGIACVKWKDKCTVILLPSIYSPTDAEEVRRKESDVKSHTNSVSKNCKSIHCQHRLCRQNRHAEDTICK